MTQRLAFLTGLATLLLLWSLAASNSLPAILPGPLTVATAFVQIITDPAFWTGTLVPSIGRAVAGLVLAFTVGASLGLAGWRWPVVSALLGPLRLVLMGLPAPILAILCILWFDGGTTTTVLTVAALLLPVFQIAIAEGMNAMDPQLREMAHLFRVPLIRRLHRIALPALWTALAPALRVAVANSIRVTLLTELLSGTEGLGAAVQRAHSWLQTDRLFALVIVILALIGLSEAALAALTPTRNRS
ncbi:ABC transporter permease [Rhizobium sp. PAMB 3182]